MSVILYQRKETTPLCRSVIDPEKYPGRAFYELIAQNGSVCLLPQSLGPKMEAPLSRLKFTAIPPGSPGVELFRQLKLHTQSMKSLPRFIFLKVSSTGAFKRSFSPFIERRHTHETPACLLFLPDFIHEKLLHEPAKIEQRESSSSPPWSENVYLSRWLKTISRDPQVIQLGNEFLGTSPATQLIRAMIFKAGQTDSPVLILGESGTGKNMIARLIHKYSGRSKAPMISIDCSGISETLFENELFGHVKGAYTDAVFEKTGLFKEADQGTLFLDEIGELSSHNQAKFLTSIGSGMYRKVGSNHIENSNVRIIAATNSNLPQQVKLKTFRADLFFRLNGFQIQVPPLRDRPDDIPVIARAFWKSINKKYELSDAFLEYLKTEPWPGNVRELQTVLNGINDLFKDMPPSQEAVEALRYLRKEIDIPKKTDPLDFDHTIRIENKLRLEEAIRIIRLIKIYLRPLINNEIEIVRSPRELKRIREYVDEQNKLLDNLCREPLYFKDPDLYNDIRRFRFEMDKVLKNLPNMKDNFREIWYHSFYQPYQEIFRKIFKLAWQRN
ncbi:MAG TPA: sigma 54-interacting transcriptional regulator [Bacteroidales bacterium]|nr:sigma 54-interacting transcriptional regulator [Bacteroidales bacterium]HPT10190.1 sigma 54-interacting transcriptional regulator [Bacteroidales bacterium]